MLRRLDLGYALNAHMAQGMTKPEAIEVISSSQRNLATQRTQNVLNTRATDDMMVVTNNLEGLKQQLGVLVPFLQKVTLSKLLLLRINMRFHTHNILILCDIMLFSIP